MSSELTGGLILSAATAGIWAAIKRGRQPLVEVIEKAVLHIHAWSYGAAEGVRAYRAGVERARERMGL